MRAVVKKWGNSASIRIPASIMTAVGLKLDQPVDVREENGRVVIEPVTNIEYDLTELLSGITPENVHAEVEFGASAGRERL